MAHNRFLSFRDHLPTYLRTAHISNTTRQGNARWSSNNEPPGAASQPVSQPSKQQGFQFRQLRRRRRRRRTHPAAAATAAAAAGATSPPVSQSVSQYLYPVCRGVRSKKHTTCARSSSLSSGVCCCMLVLFTELLLVLTRGSDCSFNLWRVLFWYELQVSRSLQFAMKIARANLLGNSYNALDATTDTVEVSIEFVDEFDRCIERNTKMKKKSFVTCITVVVPWTLQTTHWCTKHLSIYLALVARLHQALNFVKQIIYCEKKWHKWKLNIILKLCYPDS